jgi:hypothetical protein
MCRNNAVNTPPPNRNTFGPPTQAGHHRCATPILTGSDVAGLLDTDEMFRALRSGFLVQAQTPAPGLRVRADLPGPDTATALLPGLLPAIPAYTVKINAKFPGRCRRCAASCACTASTTAACWPCSTRPA